VSAFVNQEQLAPVADILIPAYLGTASYSKQFNRDYGQPPTLMAKVHHMRSIAQASLNQTDRFLLAEPFVEFGRVQFDDTEHDRSYLLRSESAIEIERVTKQRESLFDPSHYLVSPIVLLVYRFHKNGLDLSVAGAKHAADRVKLEISGTPTYIATWPYTLESSTTISSFDQGAEDAFSDLGDMNEFGNGDLE
jgi:hypothetical protein